MNPEALAEWAKLAGFATAALALASALAKFVILPTWRGLRRWRARALAREDRIAMVPVILKLIESIEKELKPNGGSSLRDGLNRIEEGFFQTRGQVHHLQQMAWLTLQELQSGVLEMDASGSCLRANHNFCRMVGRSSEELAGHAWVLAIAEPWREAALRRWNRAVQYARNEEMTVELAHSDEHRFVAIVRAQAIRAENGSVSGWLMLISRVPGLSAPSPSAPLAAAPA